MGNAVLHFFRLYQTIYKNVTLKDPSVSLILMDLVVIAKYVNIC